MTDCHYSTFFEACIDPSTVDVGQSTSVSVGITPFPATFYLNLSDGQQMTSSPCLSLPYFSFTVPLAGTLAVNATERGCFGFPGSSVVFPLEVYPDPILSAVQSRFNATPTTSADQGQSVQFAVTGSQGAPPYSFAWSGLPAQGCTVVSANGSSVATCTRLAENVSGLAVQATLTDNNSFSVTTPTLTFPVLPDPTVGAPQARGPSGTVSSGDTGQVVSFAASPQGGSGTFPLFHWSGLPPGQCGGTTRATLDCLLGPPTRTPAPVQVSVTDSNGYTSSLSPALPFSVYPAPTAGAPAALLSGETTDSADVGQTVTFSTVISGGAGGGTLAWQGLPAGCPASNGTSVTCTLSQAGASSTWVSGADGNGVLFTSSPLAFTVFPDPTVALPIASHDSRDVGQVVSFQVEASNGTGNYLRFLWSGLPAAGCLGATTDLVLCTFSAAGTYHVSVAVVDSNGMTSLPSGAVTVVVAPSLVASPPQASRVSALVGTSVTFRANSTGGAGPLSYTWHGLPPGCINANTSSLTCTLETNGTYAIWYQVRDQNGVVSTSGSTLLSVASLSPPPPPSPATVLGIPPAAGYTLLGTLLLALVLGGVLAYVVLRRPKTPSPAPPAEEKGTPRPPLTPGSEGEPPSQAPDVGAPP